MYHLNGRNVSCHGICDTEYVCKMDDLLNDNDNFTIMLVPATNDQDKTKVNPAKLILS